MKIRLLLILFLAVATHRLHAQDTRVRDSLLAALEIMPENEQRLHTRYQLILETQSFIDENTFHIEELLKEAQQQHNDYYISEAYFQSIVNAYNAYDTQAVEQILQMLTPVAHSAKRYDIYFKAKRCRIDLLILSQDYERNEKEANKLLEEARKLNNTPGILEAYQCLANTYRATFRHQEAFDILEKALPEALAGDNISTAYNIWQTLLYICQETQNIARWGSYLDDLEESMVANRADKTLFLILYGNRINYHKLRNEWDLAEQVLQKANRDVYPYVDSPLYKVYYDLNCATYFEDQGKYEKALERCDTAIREMQTISMGVDYHKQLMQKARLLLKLNRPEESLALFKQTTAFKDSLHILTIGKQYEQLKKDFKADQLLLEQAQLQNRKQISMLILLGLGLFVVSYAVIYLLLTQRRLRSDEREMRVMAQYMVQVNEAKDRFLSNIGNTIRTPLNTVVEGSLELASEEQIQTAEERQQLAETISRMSTSLLSIITDILDLSRLESGMMKFIVSEVELTRLLHEVAMSSVSKCEIRAEYPENMSFWVRCDEKRLVQLLQSIFVGVNSTGRVSVTVRIQGRMLLLIVSGSALAGETSSQEVFIRNEINRMVITHFGGSYLISHGQYEQKIRLTLPIIDPVAV